MVAASDWRAGLNESQRRAVEHDGGPLIVLAGPGTGKTRVIVSRIRRLIEDGVEPDSILALTFSVKAAQELVERLGEAVGQRAAQRVQAGTFHWFGRRVLGRFGDMLGVPAELTLMDSAQRMRLGRALAMTHGLFEAYAAQGVESRVREGSRFIEACRHAARTPRDAATFARSLFDLLREPPAGKPRDEIEAARANAEEFAALARFYELFDAESSSRGLVTFEDFLTIPLRLFAEKPIAASILRSEIRHVLVDEFQDVNAAQIEMVRAFAPPASGTARGPDLCVVGDDDQAIYGFRGAAPDAFEVFRGHYPECTTITLSENYRSGAAIIAAASAVIARANHRFDPNKTLRPAGPGREPGSVEGVECEEARMGQVVAAMILADRAAHPDRPWNAYAVIVRTNEEGERVLAAMALVEIPTASPRKLTPLDDEAVKDLLAWLELLNDASSNHATQRLLIRPACSAPSEPLLELSREHRRLMHHRATPLHLADWLIEHHSDNEAVGVAVTRFGGMLRTLRALAAVSPADRVIEAIVREGSLAVADGVEPVERARRIAHLVRVLRYARDRQRFLDPPGDVPAFMRYYADLTDEEKAFTSPSLDAIEGEPEEEASPDGVRIITAHKAKGLEFDTVFVVRVRPPHGFPKKASSGHERDALPIEFSGAREIDLDDEERRMFYVAMTRARRRLVMLAKPKKSISDTIDYFQLLTKQSPELSISVVSGDAWLERASMVDVDELDKAMNAADMRPARLLRRAASALRREALGAIDAAESAGTSAEWDRLAEAKLRLDRAAGLLASVAHLRARGRLPATADVGEDAAVLERLEAALARGSRVTVMRAMSAPLSLSYSSVTDFESCSRCFYVKHVLGLDEPKTDALSIGDVVHGVLKEHVRRRADAESEGTRPPGLEELMSSARERYNRQWPASRAFDPEPLRIVEGQLRMFNERFLDDAQPIHLEGRIESPFEAGGAMHTLIAKFDRVDRLASGAWRIVDYKTGRARRELLTPKSDDLQLGVYAMLLPALLQMEEGALVEGVAEYWVLSTGERGTISLADLDLDKVRTRIRKAAEGMLRGDYPRGAERTCKGLCTLLFPDE